MTDLKYPMSNKGDSPLKKEQKKSCKNPIRNKALMIRRYDKYLDNYFYYTEIFKDLK